MKELNEYTAEVMRRSQNKKLERKAKLKKAIGSSCAAVCACAFGLLIFSGIKETFMAGGAAPDSETPVSDHITDGADGAAAPLFLAEVTIDGETFPLNDEHAAEVIAILGEASEEGSDSLASAGSDLTHEARPDGADPVRIRISVFEDGALREYDLNGTIFTDGEGRVFVLDAEAYTRLLEITGIKTN